MENIWPEKYRPKSVSEVIFADNHTKRIFDTFVQEKSFPNLMITGSQGTGKTSVVGALINDVGVHEMDYMKVNCSNEKVEAIRSKVLPFAYSMPYGKFKVVRLEEFDFLSGEGQALLRDVMEEVQESCRFVATGNYIHRIMPPVRSRFHEFRFEEPKLEDVLLRCAEILVAENVTFDISDLEKIVGSYYPDIRKILTTLEVCSKQGNLIIVGDQESASDWKLQLFPLLEKGDFKAARKVVCESATKEELVDVYRFLFLNLGKIPKLVKKEDQVIPLLAQYQYQHSFAADPEIQVAALFVELGAL